MDEEAAGRLRALCQAVAAGDVAPYDGAWDMWGLGMTHAVKDGKADDVAWAHWLIWGALTDWIELKPDEKAMADAAIVDAAGEWLVAEGDPATVKAYLDRMVFEVCGYERPANPPRKGGAWAGILNRVRRG